MCRTSGGLGRGIDQRRGRRGVGSRTAPSHASGSRRHRSSFPASRDRAPVHDASTASTRGRRAPGSCTARVVEVARQSIGEKGVRRVPPMSVGSTAMLRASGRAAGSRCQEPARDDDDNDHRRRESRSTDARSTPRCRAGRRCRRRRHGARRLDPAARRRDARRARARPRSRSAAGRPGASRGSA